MRSGRELPKAEQRALQALFALQLYGQRAAVGDAWPRPLPGAETAEDGGGYGVDAFGEYAGLSAKEAAAALTGLSEKGLVVFTPVGLAVTSAGVLAGVTGVYALGSGD